MMQAVIHDWDDHSCAKILGNIRQAMPAGGKLLVIENVLEPHHGRDYWTLRATDLPMLVLTGPG